MSVSILLVPAALSVVPGALSAVAGVIAAYSSQRTNETASDGTGVDHTAQAANNSGATVLQVQTRMRDTGLLVRAFEELGAVVREATDEAVVAELNRIRLTMSRDNSGVWLAHVEAVSAVDAGQNTVQDAVTEEEAAELLRLLDATYGKLVQQAVVERIHAQAENVGMRVSSQTVDADQNIHIVLDTRNADS